MRPTALRACRAITSLTLLLAVAGCGDGKAFVEGRDAEREGKVHVAYERYCRAAAEHPDSGAVAAALRRTIPRAAAHWESRGRIAERQRRTGEAWQMYMRALAIHPNDPFLADVIRGLEKDNETEIAGARLTWMRRGYPALAVRLPETVVADARPSKADIEPVGSATDATNGASEATAPDEAVAQVTETPSVDETVVNTARPSAKQAAQPELADAGHTDDSNASAAAAIVPKELPPAIAKNTEAGPPLSATPRVPENDPPGAENPPATARTNLADALAWLDSLRESEHDGHLPDAEPAPEPHAEPPHVVSVGNGPGPSPAESAVGDANVASPLRGRRALPEPSLDPDRPPPEPEQSPMKTLPVVKDALVRATPSENPAPPVESTEPSGGRPTGAPILASPRARQVPQPPEYDVRSKPRSNGPDAGGGDGSAVPAFLSVHTLSRSNHRYVKLIEAVDGVTIKLKDTDSEGDADLNLYYGRKRFKKVRDIRVGQAATFRGQSGRLFKMVILDIQHKSKTIRFGIKPA
ncbi:MAG: hypothetical protein ACE5F9_11230 [Phycisphaerae bacterium]